MENRDEVIVSVSWLHVIREHPVFLRNYYALFHRVHACKRNLALAVKKSLHLAKIAVHLLRSVFSGQVFFSASGHIRAHVDFFFISHLIQETDAGSEKDFYFNEFISSLEGKGYTVAVALINHTKRSDRQLAKKWQGARSPRILFSDTLGFFSELHSFRSIWKASLRISQATKHQAGFSSLVGRYAAVEAFGGGTFANLRRYKQLNHLLKFCLPRCVVFTYEGHAWERMVTLAARRRSGAIVTVGYQHAALFRLQHAIARNLGHDFDPDYILASGEKALSMLNQNLLPATSKLQLAGSSRGRKSDGEYHFPDKNFLPGSAVNILVAPEGILSECFLLFDHAIEQAKIAPSVSFFFQLHPIINKQNFINSYHRFGNLPPNVRWSSSDVGVLAINYTHILYRGTTMVINAAINGIQPVYYSVDNSEMPIDPLYDIDSFKLHIASEMNLGNLINDYREKSLPQIREEYERMKLFCFAFYAPVNTEILPGIFADTTAEALS